MAKRGKNRHKPKPDDKILGEFLRRFLRYEMEMLSNTYAILANPPNNQLLVNVFIESFCVHARNIIEFVMNHHACDVDPRWFTNDNYQIRRDFLRKSLRDRVNAQIAHLSYERTTDTKKKIGSQDRKELVDVVEQQLSRFHGHLKDEWKSSFSFELNISTISVEGTPSATNHIEIIRSNTTSAEADVPQ